MVRIWRAGDQLPAEDKISRMPETRDIGNGGHTLEHVETDTTKLVDVGMVDLCEEADLWWSHRIVVGEEELKLEDTTCNTVSNLNIRR